MTDKDLTRAEVEALMDGMKRGDETLRGALLKARAINDLDAAAPTLAGQLLRCMDERERLLRDGASIIARDDALDILADLKTQADDGDILCRAALQLIRGQQAENARLRAMLTPPDDLRTYTPDYLTYNDDHGLPGDMPMVSADIVTQLRADIARLREALKPFEYCARERCADDPTWNENVPVRIVVTIGDLRAVFAALTGDSHD